MRQIELYVLLCAHAVYKHLSFFTLDHVTACSKVTDTPTSNGLTFNFVPTTPLGKGWVQVVSDSHKASMGITPATIKAGSIAAGGASCKFTNDTVTRGSRTLVLSGCSLTRGNTYSAVAYVEDERNGGDGTRGPPRGTLKKENLRIRSRIWIHIRYQIRY